MKHQPVTPDAATATDAPEDFTPTHVSPRADGWTAERQRVFIAALAETGCISEACHQAGITARSAYRLRAHPQGHAFALAWDLALRSATAKLLTLAFERAVRGSLRQVWRDDKLVSETRQPSDQMLTFLLSRLAPANADQNTRWARIVRTADDAGRSIPALLPKLSDCEVTADALGWEDYRPDPKLNSVDFDRADDGEWDA